MGSKKASALHRSPTILRVLASIFGLAIAVGCGSHQSDRQAVERHFESGNERTVARLGGKVRAEFFDRSDGGPG
jgi:hypothetical protein